MKISTERIVPIVVAFIFSAIGAFGQEKTIRRILEERSVVNIYLGDFLVSPNLRQIVMRSGGGLGGSGTISWITPWYNGIAYDANKYGPGSALMGGPTSKRGLSLVNGGKQIIHIFSDPNVIYSQDGNHLAIWGYLEDKKQTLINIDGQDGPFYEGYESISHFTFSPDGTRYAYWVRKSNNDYVIVVNGKEEGFYNRPGKILFSPDSKRIAYIAQAERKIFVVVDGKRGFEEQVVQGANYGDLWLVFSQNSEHFYYGLSGLRLDGEEQVLDPTVKYVYPESVSLSPDGKHLCYIAQSAPVGNLKPKSTKAWIVIDGKSQKQYGPPPKWEIAFAPVFSPDSQTVAYSAREGDDYFLVWKGIEGKRYPAPINRVRFSPDSSQLVYPATVDIKKGTRELVLWTKDGESIIASGEVYDADFDPNGKGVIYRTYGHKKEWWTRTGEDHPEFSWVSLPVFSPDNKHMVYAAYDYDPETKQNKWKIVVDGKMGDIGFPEGPGWYRQDDPETRIRHPLVYFDSPDRFHYLAWKASVLYMVDEKLVSEDIKE